MTDPTTDTPDPRIRLHQGIATATTAVAQLATMAEQFAAARREAAGALHEVLKAWQGHHARTDAPPQLAGPLDVELAGLLQAEGVVALFTTAPPSGLLTDHTRPGWSRRRGADTPDVFVKRWTRRLRALDVAVPDEVSSCRS